MTHAAIRLLPGSLYDRMMIALGPVAWWKLADAVGSSTAKDSSGNGYDGTVNGGVTFGEAGPLSGTPADAAALFDGTTGYIATTTAVPQHLSTGSLTVVTWFKTSNVTTEQCLWGSDSQIALFLQNGQIYSYLGGNGGSVALTAPTDGAWHMFAISYAGNGSAARTVYLDSAPGVLVGNGVPSDWSSDFYIGKDGASSFNYGGDIAQVAIFDTALTPTQIADLYAAASV